jgi:hypothetical protein
VIDAIKNSPAGVILVAHSPAVSPRSHPGTGCDRKWRCDRVRPRRGCSDQHLDAEPGQRPRKPVKPGSETWVRSLDTANLRDLR